MSLAKRHPFMTFWVVMAILWTLMGAWGNIPKFQTINGVDCIQTSQNITCNWAGYQNVKEVKP